MVTLPPIPSAVSVAEANRLAQLATGKVVLEIGCDYGFSTCVLAQTAARVHAVDWFRGDPHAGQRDTLFQFWENLGIVGMRHKVIVHIGDAADVVPLFPVNLFDLVFIDAFHEEDAVYQDGSRCLTPTKPNGVITFHDYGRFTVAPAVDRLCQQWGARLELVESLAVLHLPGSGDG